MEDTVSSGREGVHEMEAPLPEQLEQQPTRGCEGHAIDAAQVDSSDHFLHRRDLLKAAESKVVASFKHASRWWGNTADVEHAQSLSVKSGSTSAGGIDNNNNSNRTSIKEGLVGPLSKLIFPQRVVSTRSSTMHSMEKPNPGDPDLVGTTSSRRASNPGPHVHEGSSVISESSNEAKHPLQPAETLASSLPTTVSAFSFLEHLPRSRAFAGSPFAGSGMRDDISNVESIQKLALLVTTKTTEDNPEVRGNLPELLRCKANMYAE